MAIFLEHRWIGTEYNKGAMALKIFLYIGRWWSKLQQGLHVALTISHSSEFTKVLVRNCGYSIPTNLVIVAMDPNFKNTQPPEENRGAF